MADISNVIRKDESAIFNLRALYNKFGYAQYKMSKFEEYDLYAKNKDFLVSDFVITFTDTDGKLMALKPDVTLSIIKNGKDNPDRIQKVYYNENVYRVAKGTHAFKEIMQAGLECLGAVDDYAVAEVLYLASESLKSISSEYVLDVSSLDVINAVMDDANLSDSDKKEIIVYLSEKNTQGVLDVCERAMVTDIAKNNLVTFVSVYGEPERVMEKINSLEVSPSTAEKIKEFNEILGILKTFSPDGNINVDFSVVNDLNYYNGIVFKGFVSGIPTGILSGGQYDNLMGKMGYKSKAIGFAVYLDELEKLSSVCAYEVDVAIIYGNTDLKKVGALVKEITDGGETVLAQKILPEKLKYKRLIELK